VPKMIAREPAAIIARTKSKNVKFVIVQAKRRALSKMMVLAFFYSVFVHVPPLTAGALLLLPTPST
jgi:hypothetical protein